MTDKGVPTPEEAIITETLDQAIVGFNDQIKTAFGGHDFRHINATVARFWELNKDRGDWISRPTQVNTGLLDLEAFDATSAYHGPTDSMLAFGHLNIPENTRRPGKAGPYIEVYKRTQYVGRDSTYDSFDLKAIDSARALLDLALEHQPDPFPTIENPNPNEEHPERHKVVRDIVERVFAGLGGDRFTFINASLNSGVFIRLEDNERDDMSQIGYGYELKIENWNHDTILKIPGLNPYRTQSIPVAPWFHFRTPDYRLSNPGEETIDPEAIQKVYTFLDDALPIRQTK